MTRYLVGFMCVLALGVMGCSETAGDGGSGGSAGIGGTGGAMREACVPSERECISSEIDPIEEMCEIFVPDQANACDGTESIENPTSCTATGNTVTHQLTKMQIAADCNAGFNLDGCDGHSCEIGGLASAEGANGVDNALGGSGATWAGLGLNLGAIDQVFHDAICTGGIDIEIEIDAVPEERCAVVKVSAAGIPGDPIPMNLSDDGCLSGTLGTIPIGLGDVQGAIENAVVRITVSSAGFSDGILGGTADETTAGAMFEEIQWGRSAIVEQFFDINADLSGDSMLACDSLSLILEIGGDAVCPQIDCDDGNECTKNVCNAVDATCDHPPAEDGTLCAGGLCISGECGPIGSVFPCTEQGIRSAIVTGGGPYTFDCDGPQTVVTQATIIIDNDVILDGEGNLRLQTPSLPLPRTLSTLTVIFVKKGVAAELRGFTVAAGERDDYPINSEGTMVLTNSTVTGRVRNFGTMTLTNSTAVGPVGWNSIENDRGALTVSNSTVSGTELGIANSSGTLVMTSSTLTIEGGLFIAIQSGSEAEQTIANSLVVGDCRCHGCTSVSGGYNIESEGDTCGFDQPTDQVNVSAEDLKLGELADNGGPTMTHALGAGSVAIDVIPADMCKVTEDQRGEPRPETGGSMCDVGSFEVQP